VSFLTGRPSEAIGEADFLTNTTKILTVRPLRPDQVRSYVDRLASLLSSPPLVTGERIRPWRLDHRRFEIVLAEYEAAFKASGASRSHKLDVLAQPLLLHLASRVIASKTGNPHELIENPTHLFRNLIDQTTKGGKAIQDDTTMEYTHLASGGTLREFLRKIALAIQESGSETITQPELEARLKVGKG
jgi:hypothetical protein